MIVNSYKTSIISIVYNYYIVMTFGLLLFQANQCNSNNPNTKKTKPSRHLKIVTLENPPFMMRLNESDLSEEIISKNISQGWYGYCVDFFEELIKHLPYEVTYEIYQVADNKFGTKFKHVSIERVKGQPPVRKVTEDWNGLVGDLEKRKADLALAPLAVMAERELDIDFTVPFYDLIGIQILLKKPEVPKDWFKFLTVLDNEVWFSITIAYLVTSFFIFLFDRLSPYSHKNLSRIQRLRDNRKKHSKEARQKANGLPLPFDAPTFNADWKDSMYDFSGGQSFGPLTKSLRSDVAHDGEKNKHETSFMSNILSYRKDSIHPVEDSNRFEYPQKDHQSGDHQPGINLRKSLISWGNRDDDSESDVEDGKPDFGLRDSLWFCITSLTPQGGGEAPQNLSGRVVAGAWWLFCFIVIASYTANLAAFLTVSRLDIPIESLDDLAKQYRIKYAPIDGTAENAYFERMAYIEEIFYNVWKQMSLNDSLSEAERAKFAVWDYPISDKYTKIWAQIQQVGMPESVEAGIRRAKMSTLEDGFALLADANLVKHAVMTDCSFKAVGDEFSRKPIALGLRKGDEQLKEDLSYAILQLINQRYMEVLREKWWTNNPKRVICDSNDESEGISIENIGGVFIIIFAGVFLSFCVWAIERFVYSAKIGVSKEIMQRL